MQIQSGIPSYHQKPSARFGAIKQPVFSGDSLNADQLKRFESVVKGKLSPDLQKRLDKIDRQHQRVIPFILSDVDDYLSYQEQPPVIRDLVRLVIGLFQPWRTQPAFEALRHGLEKEVISDKHSWLTRRELKREFRQQFTETVQSLKGDLTVLQRHTGLEDRSPEQLFQLLNAGQMAIESKPGERLNTKNLYTSLFYFVNHDDPQVKSFISPLLQQYAMRFKQHAEVAQQVMVQTKASSEGSHSPLLNPYQPIIIPGAGMSVDETHGIGSVTQKYRQQPSFDHTLEVRSLVQGLVKDKITNFAVLSGDLEDQKDALIQLANHPEINQNLAVFVLQNSNDLAFSHYWSEIPARAYGFSHLVAESPVIGASMPQDFVAMVTQTMHMISQNTPKNKTGFLYLMGSDQQKLKPILSQLPAFGRMYPNVKIVIGGSSRTNDMLPPEVKQQALPVTIARPTVAEALNKAKQVVPLELNEIENRYKVRITSKTLEAMVKTLDNSGNRPPKPEAVYTALAKLAVWSREHADLTALQDGQSATQSADSILDVTPDYLALYLREEALLQGTNMVPLSFNGSTVSSMLRPVGLDSVLGQDKAVTELRKVTENLKNFKLLKGLEEPMPNLYLLSGPSGTGKTFSVQALAAEAGVPVIAISASELVKKYVGVGPERVRELYEQARRQTPSIVYIDEIDAVAMERGGVSGGETEFNNTLIEILNQIDGFYGNEGVVTLVSTNRPDILDKAFHNRVVNSIQYEMPNAEAREGILKSLFKQSNYQLDDDVNLGTIAKNSEGLAGRELKALYLRVTNSVRSEARTILAEYRDAAEPDIDALKQRLPKITQALLEQELAEMKKETQGKKGKLGFNTNKSQAA